MTKPTPAIAAVLAATVLFAFCASAQYSTPPISTAELEAVYTAELEHRATNIIAALALTDAAKANRVHDVIVAQYRALKARDAVLDAAYGHNHANPERIGVYETLTKPLHDRFLAELAADLTPEQIEQVKDKMTYSKVKHTYDGYCMIVPDLTDTDKAKVLEVLKQAREEAIDGGSAPQKTAIFEKYKTQINTYLDEHGHDVAKALKDFEAKQTVAESQKDASDSKSAPSPQ